MFVDGAIAGGAGSGGAVAGGAGSGVAGVAVGGSALVATPTGVLVVGGGSVEETAGRSASAGVAVWLGAVGAPGWLLDVQAVRAAMTASAMATRGNGRLRFN
ncbi:MAG: hypothetical protein IIB28_01205 [Chloroflexi bacterium]|nr:hypothetical protein [Chloroflexota bacterium]